MTAIHVEDPGYGCPLRVTFRVEAIGSTDAAERAKAEARKAGYRVRTLGRIDLVEGQEGDPRHDRMTWDVVLVARPAEVVA